MKPFAKLRYVIWLVLLLLAGWSLRSIPFNQIGETLRSLQVSDLGYLLLINITIFLLFSSRWWLILRVQGYSPPYFALVSYKLAAFGISYFTPGTQFGGEPMQVYMLEKQHNIPNSTSLAAVSLDKLIELLANFTFLLVGLITIFDVGLLDGIGNPLTIVSMSALIGLPVIYLGALWSVKAPLSRISTWLPHRIKIHPKLTSLSNILKHTEAQISILLRQYPLMVYGILLLSGLIWLLMLAEYWLALSFLGAQISLSQSIIALTAARLAFLTPLPGGLGALEASQVIALQALGFSSSLGISISLLIRGRDILFGLMGLWWGAFLTRRTPYRSPLAAQTIQPKVIHHP